MPAELVDPHIRKLPDESARLEKHPRTRVSMIVADYIWRGWSAEEIVRHYPYLTLAETHSALVYYFDHREEIEAELVAETREVDEWKARNPTPAFLVRLKDERKKSEV